MVRFKPFLNRVVTREQGLRFAFLELAASNFHADRPLTTSDTRILCRTAWTYDRVETSRVRSELLTIKSTHELLPTGIDYPQSTISERSNEANESLAQLWPLDSKRSLFELHSRLAAFSRNLDDIDHLALCLKIATRAFELSDEDEFCDRLSKILVHSTLDGRELTVEKKRSPHLADYSVRFSLSRSEYERMKGNAMTQYVSGERHRAYVALGSNVGDRVNHIQSACQRMKDRGIAVVRTSPLYETTPMYLEDQQNFVNGVCEVCTMAIHSGGRSYSLSSNIDRDLMRTARSPQRAQRD